MATRKHSKPVSAPTLSARERDRQDAIRYRELLAGLGEVDRAAKAREAAGEKASEAQQNRASGREATERQPCGSCQPYQVSRLKAIAKLASEIHSD
jgi:hypothetical protein